MVFWAKCFDPIYVGSIMVRSTKVILKNSCSAIKEDIHKTIVVSLPHVILFNNYLLSKYRLIIFNIYCYKINP